MCVRADNPSFMQASLKRLRAAAGFGSPGFSAEIVERQSDHNFHGVEPNCVRLVSGKGMDPLWAASRSFRIRISSVAYAPRQ